MAIVNYEITLDLVTNNYVAIRAKQGDINARKVIVSCTANGEEYKLHSGVRADIVMKKPDGHMVANPCECDLDRNVIIADLTEQMLAVKGNGYAEIVLRYTDSKEVISTMSFTVVIALSAHTDDTLISSDEFTSLGKLTITVEEMKKALESLEADIVEQETIRQRNENERIANENARKANETQRIANEEARKKAESARATAETERIKAETARKAEETKRIQQEQGRVTAETQRVSTENTRVANENNRVSAENKRQEDTAKAIENCNTTVQKIEDKLQNGEFDGKTVLYGEGIPPKSLGNAGDIYINTLPTGLYAHYLFTKDGADWTPRWNTQGIDGTDTLPILSTLFLPEDQPIPEGYEEVVGFGFNTDSITYKNTQTLTQIIDAQDKLIKMLQAKIQTAVYFQ